MERMDRRGMEGMAGRARDGRGRFVGEGEMERFGRLVGTSRPVGCWLWLGPVGRKGYGAFRVKRGDRWDTVPAHRYAFELEHGPIAQGLTLDHLIGPGEPCSSILCVRPDHLEPVTDAENTRRRWQRQRAMEGAS
jgi:hypothetical protein